MPPTTSDRLPPVITGLGAVTPIGIGVPAFRAALRAGASGTRLLGFSHPQMRSTAAATCEAWDPLSAVPEAEAARLPRLVPMAFAAAREAMTQACLAAALWAAGDDPGPSRRVGLLLGTGGGGIDFTLDQAASYHAGGRTSLWTITNATHGNLAGELSIRLGLRGPSLCVSDGCASSSDALAHAVDLLRSERAGAPEACVVVGADAHVRAETLIGMEHLKVISTRRCSTPEEAAGASRPFDATRDGFVLGEGAWAMVVERRAHAEARGAPVLGEVLGVGQTCDAYHRVRPDPAMTECVRAMRLALEDAGLGPEGVGLIHLHGTGTRLNDEQEARAVRLAFGAHAGRLIGTSVKGAIGHPQGASGLAAAVASLAALTGGEPFCPPTVNLREPDPACGLDCTPLRARTLGRSAEERTVLVNCLAFGAKNTALVLRAAEGAGQDPRGG